MINRLVLSTLLAGCTVADTDKTASGIDFDTGEAPASCPLGAVLEIVPLDIWGRDLESIGLVADVPSTPASALGPGALWLAIKSEDAVVNLTVSAADHLEASGQIRHRGDGQFELLGLSDEARWAQSAETATVEGERCDVTTFYIGIDHAWFASTGRPPSLNHVSFLYDPETFWSAAYKDLEAARRRVSWSTWWWESDFELVRPMEDTIDMADHTRWAYTAMGILNTLDAVERRILVNRFWDDNLDFTAYVSADSDLLDRATSTGDAFELILQGNPTEVPVTEVYEGEPTPIDFASRVRSNPRYEDRDIISEVHVSEIDLELQVASWHQKGIVIDGDLAYIGGMNTKGVDWDTEDHFVFDPRRMPYEATVEDRQAVADRLKYPDHIPRRDYGIRVQGPAAWDSEEIFKDRWQYGIDHFDMYAEHASPMDLEARPSDVAGGVPSQTTATMPEPWNEMSIWETHSKAIMQATEYIFIEDQYFRAPVVLDEVIARMTDQPDLLLTVVTMDVSWYDGGKKYTYLADSTLRDLFPDRYQLLVLKTVDLVIEDGWFYDEVTFHQQSILTHSKLRIIDDRYLSVGSCNFNNRGYKYEGELNLSVLDETTAIDTRRHIYQNLVGPDWWAYLSDDAQNNFDVMAAAAEFNLELSDWWEENAPLLDADEANEYWPDYRPSGFLYPLQIANDWQWDIGPDLY